MNYKDTLNLPKTNFSMKANLPQREPAMLKKWQEDSLYEAIRKRRKGKPKFILHDGPPYANGNIHMGHVLNKVLKDIVIKYKTMTGSDAPYIPGWDCHGLPVEHQLFKELRITKYDINQVDFRKKAHKYAMKFVKIQRDEFERLGIFGDWENPYLTLNPKYEAAILQSFASLVKKGYIYKGLKPVNWCAQCETALAEAEVEYNDKTSPSVYVRFKDTKEDRYFLIWTTTPWTLLANVAITVHPDLDYVVAKTQKGNLIIAKSRLEEVMAEIGENNFEIIETIKGKSLENLEVQHPFIDRISKIVLADYVTIEDGTGCVHTAPGHGEADHITGKKYNLSVIMPIDSKGRVDKTGGEFKGLSVLEANNAIIEKLKSSGDLLASGEVTHSYPHCWRCKKPIIFRATQQYFMGIDIHNLRGKMLKAIKKVKWIPVSGVERISAMVKQRPDWCLSRQRYWGVPIPGFYCADCDELILDAKAILHLADIVEKEGSNVYFIKDAGELLPKNTKCPKCGAKNFKKETDIIDVWFESGVSHQAVLKPDKFYPADLYLEGSDQHRGWFQTSLITACGINDSSPYKAVLTHGFTVDGEGKKMSKSLGNVVPPQDIMSEYGADILRLWVASSDYSGDVRVSDQIFKRVSESYRKIRNTLKYLLSNLYDFKEEYSIPNNKLLEIDQWALSKTKALAESVKKHYDAYSFHAVYRAIYEFSTVFLSSIYLDILKDRMYTFLVDSQERRSGQTAMFKIGSTLIRLLAPLLPFTAEEAWEELMKEKATYSSVHLADWPLVSDFPTNKKFEAKYEKLLNFRQSLLLHLENERIAKRLGSSLEAKVELRLKNPNDFNFFKENEGELPSLFIVSQVEAKKADSAKGQKDEIAIKIMKADGAKCMRCWNYSLSVGKNKEHPDICHRCSKNIKGGI